MDSELIAKIEEIFGIEPGSIQGKSHKREISEARHAYCLVERQSGKTLARIGSSLGRDHSTAWNSVDKATDLMFVDSNYKNKVKEITEFQTQKG